MTSLTPTLAVIDGIPRASSLDIADHFGKRHVDVMRAINNSVTQVPEDFAQRNFAFSDYRDSTGRNLPKCDLSHDGFSFVVMGFTGKEAAKWKVVYIMAFRAMAEELSGRVQSQAALDTDSRLSTRKDPERKALASLKSVWVSMAPFGYKDASAMVNAHFSVSGVDEMTVAQCRDATAWIQGQIDALLKALPTPEPQRALPPAPDPAIARREKAFAKWNEVRHEFNVVRNDLHKISMEFQKATRDLQQEFPVDIDGPYMQVDLLGELLWGHAYMTAAIGGAVVNVSGVMR